MVRRLPFICELTVAAQSVGLASTQPTRVLVIRQFENVEADSTGGRMVRVPGWLASPTSHSSILRVRPA